MVAPKSYVASYHGEKNCVLLNGEVSIVGGNCFHYPEALFKPVVMGKLSDIVQELCYTILL